VILTAVAAAKLATLLKNDEELERAAA